jgi:hypothetical protein
VAADRSAAQGRVCSKCGGEDILVRWHTGGRYGTGGCGYYAKVVQPSEHLHCTCRSCQYEWAEDTLDNLAA